MVYIPFILSHLPNMLEDNFGLDPDEVLQTIKTCPQHSHICNNKIMTLHSAPWRTFEESASQNVESNTPTERDQFQVSLNVKHFTPEEITVKTVGKHIIVEAKHEEKQDDRGYISRHFVRKYSLPDEHRSEDVVSNLSTDGILVITAPRRTPPAVGERIVPITTTGQTSTPVANGSSCTTT